MTQEKIKEATDEIIGYFKDYEVTLINFNLEECAASIGVSIDHAHVFLCNIEDTEVMSNIAKGYYDLDYEDESIFNDCYHDMMQDLGYEESDEEE